MASPLVTQILGILSGKPAVDEEKRRRSMQNFVDQLSIANVVRQNAAETPLADAPPEQTLEEAAAAKGIPPMSHDVASVAATYTPQPKRSISIVGPGGKKIALAPLEYEEEAKAKKLQDLTDTRVASGEAMMVTPEINAAIDPTVRALFPAGKAIPSSLLGSLIKQDDYAVSAHTNPLDGTTEYRIFNKKLGKFVDQPSTETTTQGKPDYTKSGEDFIQTLPAQRQPLVRGIGLGHIKPPASFGRTGPGLGLMQDVTTAYPDFDSSVVNARWQARQDIAKGGQYSAKNIVATLGQAAKHIQELKQASDLMQKEGWGTHNSQWLNAAGQYIMPTGLQAAVTGYRTAAGSVKSEYIRALKNGVPSVEEEKVFKALDDPSLPLANREEAMQTMLKFIQARANQQEEWFQNIFHHPSTEDEIQLFSPKSGWTYDSDTGGWRVPGLSTETKPTTGAAPGGLDALLQKHGYQKGN